jgi:deoxyribodipyrimidine photo-lyase
VWDLSPKQEFAARTIRSKVHAKLPLFLEEFATLKNHTYNNGLLDSIKSVDWEDVKKRIVCDMSATPVITILKGEKAAKKVLDTFLQSKLEKYDTSRNEINADGQSNLSPYITHGNISRRRIILELLKVTGVKIEDAFDPVMNGSNGRLGSVAAFIEECVVRSELCENYCYYNEWYDSYEGFPDWAKKTLDAHKGDTRDYLYTYEELEQGKTHDELWNAAQMQMVHAGKMHGYMRMYWAKKILEWTATPEIAMAYTVKLNDTYELDGRDPNGYVGCAWSIGGVHDRPWFNRPVYGTIRYMAASGVEKRGSIKEYIAKNNGAPKLL